MRIPFSTREFEAFRFVFKEKTCSYPDCERVAERANSTANVHEDLLRLPDGTIVWLTVVGDDENPEGRGTRTGWYTVVELEPERAQRFINSSVALYDGPFTR